MQKWFPFSVGILIVLACIGLLSRCSSSAAEQQPPVVSGDVVPGAVGSILSGLSGSAFLSSPDEDSEARKHAVEIWEQAALLQQEKRYEEALEKYREGLEIFEDPVVRDHVTKMEDFIARLRRREERNEARDRAVAVWKHAAELQIAGKYEEALEKYREGLAISPDAVVQEHVGKLEEFIARREAHKNQKEPSP
jgi:tetratricopeptide (TPR) repeat protein